jgi:hypothetical protein
MKLPEHWRKSVDRKDITQRNNYREVNNKAQESYLFGFIGI